MYKRASQFGHGTTDKPIDLWRGYAEPPTEQEKKERGRRQLYYGANRDEHCAHVIAWIEKHSEDDIPF